MQGQQKFFCLGPPKSGTTLLQHCLNSHPSVTCPSEHSTEFLLQEFDRVFTEYNKSLKVLDRRTGGFGPTLVTSETAAQIFRHAVEAIIAQLNPAAKAVGLKDNSMLERLDFFQALFADAKWLIIVRHPVPRGLSAWQHNQQLAVEEQDPRHYELAAADGGVDAWVIRLARQWNQLLVKFREHLQDSQKTLVIRFEDLVQRKTVELKRIFDFLEVPTGQAELEEIASLTSLGNMRSTARRPHFFRSGSVDFGDSLLSQQTVTQVEKIAMESLTMLGYVVLSDPACLQAHDVITGC